MTFIKNLLSKRYVQMLFFIILYLILRQHIGDEIKSYIITLGSLIKTAILIFIPIVAMVFIAHSVCSFREHAIAFVLLTLLIEGLSNYIVIWYSYLCGALATSTTSFLSKTTLTNDINDMYVFAISLPKWWSATFFVPMGVLLGLLYSVLHKFIDLNVYRNLIEKLRDKTQLIITQFLGPLVPLLVFCQIVVLDQKNIISDAASNYLYITIVYICICITYILLIFFIASGLSVQNMMKSIKNVLPAAGVAITSCCSITTMPSTIACTKNNLKDRSFAEFIIPATTNIQQIGDCMFHGLTCAFLYYQFNGSFPTIAIWFVFAIHFTIARYTTTAILGGAIFIMIPIYESYLNMTPDAIGILLIINAIMDPLVTVGNVVGNSAMCIIFERIWGGYKKFVNFFNLRKHQKSKYTLG